jgi:pSer/pThr/pTyr-binding forkhead associated (FHA) protein
MKKENLASSFVEMLSEHGRQPRLINITESGAREIIPLGKAMLLIGRTDEVNVTLESTDISRNHASIVKLGEHFCLRDNGSTNGSYVNGERVKFKQLEHHDIIRFGPYMFLVDLGRKRRPTKGGSGAR